MCSVVQEMAISTLALLYFLIDDSSNVIRAAALEGVKVKYKEIERGRPYVLFIITFIFPHIIVARRQGIFIGTLALLQYFILVAVV